MGGVIINSQGDEIQAETAKEAGRYYDGTGVPRQVAAGDLIPPGWVHEDQHRSSGGESPKAKDEPAKKPAGKSRRKPAANKAKDEPAESK